MAFVILRLIYGLYFLGSAVILYHFLSKLLFDRKKLRKESLAENLLLFVFWPLALFSKGGRDKLQQLKETF